MKEKKYYVGCDVSKGYADFVIIDTEKNVIEKNFQLDDTKEGHLSLEKRLKKLLKSSAEKISIYVGLESTGGYENNWYKALQDFEKSNELKVARLNPIGVHHHSKSEMNRNTTDKISAKNIAEYLINHSSKINYTGTDSTSSLKRVWSVIQLLTKQKTALLNDLEKLLYIGNTEILKYCSGGMNDWTLKLLTKYPTAARLSNASINGIKKIDYMKEQTAVEIKQAAKNTASSISDKTIEMMIQDLSGKILNLNESIKQYLKELSGSQKAEEINILTSFDGIGEYSAVGLLIEIDDIDRFIGNKGAKKLASYFGLHPVYKESGDGVWGMHMSKVGRKAGRSILFMVTMSAIQSNKLIKELYEKSLQKGMCKMSSIGVCMHKIIRIVYGMLKNKTKFDYNIDKENQKKNVVSQKTKVNVKEKRRFQEYSKNAPISRRELKKRKERKSAS